MKRIFQILGIAAALLIVFFYSCKKDKKYDAIPYAYINIYLDPNSTAYLNLNNVGGYEYLVGNSPSRGLIVYRKSVDEFMAYERTCPYDPLADCSRIQVEPSGITAIDSCCMSRFILLDGTPFSGPSTLSMKQYRTYYDGNLLHIFN